MNHNFNHEFRWRGEIIPDIEAWAKERNDIVVYYKAYRKSPSLFGGFYEEEYEDKMPMSFWLGMLISDGWVYTPIKKD